MSKIPSIVPTIEKLYSGAVLRTIVHAIYTLHSSELSYEVSWDGSNYSRQDTQGARGTITFQDDKVVGLFFDEHSKRNPFHSSVTYDFYKLLDVMPQGNRILAKNITSQYLIDDLNGVKVPVVTAGLWGVGTDISYWESFADLFQNGGQLIYFECLSDPEAMQEYQSEYQLSIEQISAIRLIFDLRVSQSYDSVISINLNSLLKSSSKSINNKSECVDLLKAVNIYAF